MLRVLSVALLLALPALANPERDPARYYAFDAPSTPEAEAEAAALLAQVLADNQAALADAGADGMQEVVAVVASWPDGRKMMLAKVVHGTTAVYGGAGAGGHLFVAAPGQPWMQQAAMPGLEVWIDTAAPGVDGWPDLVLQDFASMTQGRYALWRWTGAIYDFVEETP